MPSKKETATKTKVRAKVAKPTPEPAPTEEVSASKDEAVNAWAETPEEKEMIADSDSGSRNQIQHMKFVVGRNAVRIVGAYFPFREIWFNKIKRTAISDGKNCPTENDPRVVKLREEASALSDKLGKDDKSVKAAWKKAFEWKPKLKYAVNVIDRADGQVKIWKFSKTMKDQIVAIIEEHGDPNGFDLVVTRKGVKLDTTYTVSPARDHEPLTDEEKQLTPFILSRIFKPTSVDTIKSYMDGVIPEKKAKATTTVPEKNEVVENPEIPEGIGDADGMEDLGNI